MMDDDMRIYTENLIRQVRFACASMCRARSESLLEGGMIAAANEASKCALSIESHPAFEHHFNKVKNG